MHGPEPGHFGNGKGRSGYLADKKGLMAPSMLLMAPNLHLRFEAIGSCFYAGKKSSICLVPVCVVASGGKVTPGAVVSPGCLLSMAKPGDTKPRCQAGVDAAGG